MSEIILHFTLAGGILYFTMEVFYTLDTQAEPKVLVNLAVDYSRKYLIVPYSTANYGAVR